MSYIGTTKIGKLFLGSVEIAKAYLGSDLVFQKAGGGGGDLPAGAIPCELLYSNGYSGFVESGFTPGTSMSYEADIFWSLENAISTPFAYIINSRRYAPFMLENRRPEVQYDNYYMGPSTTYPQVRRTFAKAVITQTGATVEYYDEEGGTLLDSYTLTYNETDYTPDQTFALLGRKNSATTIVDGSWRGGLGRLRCYNDDHFGNLVADFRPCFYQGNFGYWENVGQTFKPEATTDRVRGFGDYWNTQGFLPNVRNGNGGGLVPYRTWITSRTFEIPAGCVSIRFNAGTVQTGETYGLSFFRSNGTHLTYYNYNTADRVVAVPSNSAYMRMSMTWGLEDDCYIYDVTNQQYIWKGINVQPGQFLTVTKTQVASITSVQLQGSACYGDYLLGFTGPNTTAWLWDLSTSSLVQTISIPASERGFVSDCHSNTVNFGTEFYDPGDEFPLVYVSTGYNDGNYSGALVYRIVKNGGVYSLVLVQTLKFPGTEWTEFVTAGAYCYVQKEVGGSETYYKFPMPTLQDGSEVIFDYSEAISTSSLGGKPAWYAGSQRQGRVYHGGKLYYVSGVPPSETLLLIQADLEQGVKEVEINLAEVSITAEPEAAFFWGNKLCIAFWQNATIYQIEWS